MIPRLATGAGIGALPAAAAIAGAVEGWCALLVGFFVVLTGAAFVGAVAPYWPLLHRIPRIGAPTLGGNFQVDGIPECRAGIRRFEPLPVRPPGFPADAQPNFEPRTVHLQVAVDNPVRADLPNAHVYLLHPEGIPHEETDQLGVPTDHGQWMPPAEESLMADDQGRPQWSDYWQRTRVLFGKHSHLHFFKLTFSQPGEYQVRLRVVAPALYERFDVPGTIHIEEVKRGEEPPVDRLAYVIQEAEEVLGLIEDPTAAVDEAVRVATLYLEAADTIPEGRDELHAVLKKRPISLHRGRSDAYHARLLRAYLASFYDLRRRLAN